MDAIINYNYKFKIKLLVLKVYLGNQNQKPMCLNPIFKN